MKKLFGGAGGSVCRRSGMKTHYWAVWLLSGSAHPHFNTLRSSHRGTDALRKGECLHNAAELIQYIINFSGHFYMHSLYVSLNSFVRYKCAASFAVFLAKNPRITKTALRILEPSSRMSINMFPPIVPEHGGYNLPSRLNDFRCLATDSSVCILSFGCSLTVQIHF